jgi:hypothetical protein
MRANSDCGFPSWGSPNVPLCGRRAEGISTTSLGPGSLSTELISQVRRIKGKDSRSRK